MPPVDHLLEANRTWAARVRESDPELFSRLAEEQRPRHLWIGCSDSRVPASGIFGLPPGELFVHRNIANLVVHSDLSCLSVLQYAVEVLRVEHVIVCGHYGCGGVQAAAAEAALGLIEGWLHHIQDGLARHGERLERISDEGERFDRMCEIHAIEQVRSVCRTTVVRDAWDRGQDLTVHGWIYGLADGRVRDLGVSVATPDGLAAAVDEAIDRRFWQGRPGLS